VRQVLSAKVMQRNLQLNFRIDPAVPTRLRGDYGRLRQVLLNLGSNAVKFTHSGGITISASLAWQDRGWAGVRFSVRDTGIGIPNDKLSDIFSAFTQVDSSSTRKYGGTGLGLAICKRFVELLGGEIGVESEVGKGSNFWFTAVFEQQTCGLHAGSSDTTRIVVPSAPRLRPWTRSPRILIAEDNVSNQLVARAILEKLGCRADCVANGAEVLAALRSVPYELVLMDCQMPEMSGYAAALEIRNPESGVLDPAIPIVAVTANAWTDAREKCLAAGMNDYVSKPVDPRILSALLQKWIPQHVARQCGAPVVDHTGGMTWLRD
jgi:CheY-like chemotaxis protein